MTKRKSGSVKTEEHRRAEDVALEEAFVAGVLPEEDRRETATIFEIVPPPAPPSESLDDLLSGLPVGWRAEFTRGEPADRWSVRGTSGEHGESKTLARATRLIGSQQHHDENGRLILLDHAGVVILPD